VKHRTGRVAMELDSSGLGYHLAFHGRYLLRPHCARFLNAYILTLSCKTRALASAVLLQRSSSTFLLLRSWRVRAPYRIFALASRVNLVSALSTSAFDGYMRSFDSYHVKHIVSHLKCSCKSRYCKRCFWRSKCSFSKT